MGIGAGRREESSAGGSEGGRGVRREREGARASAAPAPASSASSASAPRGPGGMGWPGGSPCCCPAPARPRPAGRPPQVSGRSARGGRAAAGASRRPGGVGRQGARGGAGRGLGGRGARGGRAGGWGWGWGPGARERAGGPRRAQRREARQGTRGRGAARGRTAVPPSRVLGAPTATGRTLAPHAGRGPEREREAARRPGPRECMRGFSFSSSLLGRLRLVSLFQPPFLLLPSILQIPPGALIYPASPSRGLTPPPRLGSQPLIQPQLFPGRGSVGGGVSPNKPKASSERGPGWGRD